MELAQRLLDAHVAHDLAQLRGPAFAGLVEQEIDHALRRASELTLGDVVGRRQVKDVAHKYVSTFRLPGAIPEIAGEIAARLREHPANATPLGEVVPRRHVLAAVAKVAELRDVRRRVARVIAASPSVQTWLGEFLRSLVTVPVDRMPLTGVARAVLARLPGPVDDDLEQRGREFSEWLAARVLERWVGQGLESLDDNELAEALLEVYDAHAERPVGELIATLDEDDLVDVLVVAYEFWLDIRTGDHLRAMIDTGVDYFFDRYESYPLDELLDEFGLDRDDLIEEALRFAPRAIEALHGTGLLEDIVRRRLAAFYDSAEARALLAPADPTEPLAGLPD